MLVPWLTLDPTAVLPGHGRVADLVRGPARRRRRGGRAAGTTCIDSRPPARSRRPGRRPRRRLLAAGAHLLRQLPPLDWWLPVPLGGARRRRGARCPHPAHAGSPTCARRAPRQRPCRRRRRRRAGPAGGAAARRPAGRARPGQRLRRRGLHRHLDRGAAARRPGGAAGCRPPGADTVTAVARASSASAALVAAALWLSPSAGCPPGEDARRPAGGGRAALSAATPRPTRRSRGRCPRPSGAGRRAGTRA